MTAVQLTKRVDIAKSTISHTLREMSRYQLISCLNPESSKGRLYWFTEFGIRCHKKMTQCHDRKGVRYKLPEIDWELYAWTCFEHRSSVIKVMEVPVSPSDIRRLLVRRFSGIRISVNNVHDIIKLFEKMGIVKRAMIRKRKRARYILTELGRKFQELHIEAEKLVSLASAGRACQPLALESSKGVAFDQSR